MKPFNLERALAGDPVSTRDGTKVTEIHLLKNETSKPIVAIINEDTYCFPLNGQFHSWNPELDLFMEPKTKKINLNLFKNLDEDDDHDDSYTAFMPHLSPIRSLHWEFIKEIEVEVEE